jgi:hypothetical protein
MRRRMKNLLLAAAIGVAGCLATACMQSASGAIATSSPSGSPSATATAQPSPTPSTAAPTPTPSTATPTPSTATPTPTSSSGFSFNLTWLWVGLGALVLLGIILLATRSPARSSAAAAGWRAKVVDAYSQGAALDGAVRAAERQGALAQAGDARWYDIQRRADDLTQTLYAMRETAPNEDRRAQVADALASLQALRRAMEAPRAPEGYPQQGGPLHARLSALESALNALRVPEDRLP